MIIISLSNHKGGTGKTTASCNLAAALANEGRRVLIVDLDAQANTSLAFGVKAPTKHIYGALKGSYSIDLACVQILPLLALVPSCLDLGAAEIELSSESGREFLLKELLEPLRSNYDYCLIDCPPNLGLLTLNAFTASNEVLIPLQPEYFAAQGLAKLMEVITKIQKRLNPTLKVGGIFVSRYDKRKSLGQAVLSSIEKAFEGKVYETKIRECVALSEAQLNGMDIFRYAPKSAGASDYKALGTELIERTT